MDAIRSQNSHCADCALEEVDSVNMQFGVFLCQYCAEVHMHFNLPIRKLSDNFNDEEISFLSKSGNQKANLSLLIGLPPWVVTPKKYNFDSIRHWWVEAKYIKAIWARESQKNVPKHDLNKFWFYIDEVTREQPKIKGPVMRQDIKKLYDEGTYLFGNSYIWHPVYGHKWTLLEKALDIITPSSAVSDASIHEACQKRLQLLNYPYPHAKGHLELVHKSKSIKKWVVLLERKIMVFQSNISQYPEFELNIEDVEISLAESNGLALVLQTRANDLTFQSSKIEEVIEWYHALHCASYLLMVLSDDLMMPNYDLSELHICNIQSSNEYMGEKIHEAILKKEGSIWKSVRSRWFVLRTQGLYYYINRTDKSPRGMIKLYPETKIEVGNDPKPSNHFLLIGEKVLHLWAENVHQKEEWVVKLNQAIGNLKNPDIQRNYLTLN